MMGALWEAIKTLFASRSSRLMALVMTYAAMIAATRINVRAVFDVIRQTFAEWGKDRAAGLAAGLAYYAIFSLAPALIIVIAIAGLVFGQEEVQQQIVAQVAGAVGPDAASLVTNMIEGLRAQSGSGVFATAVSVVSVVLGAIGAFGHLHSSLNAIWGVEPEIHTGLGSVLFVLRRSVLAFALVASAAFLMVLFVVLTAVQSAVRNYLNGIAPEVEPLLPSTNLLVSLAVVTALFTLIYRILPDVPIGWRDVLPGAFITALLFILGQFFINLYLGTSSITSIYGAAGSIIVILVWVYYSAQIFMLGAEFIKVYTRTYGSHSARARAAEAPADASEMPPEAKAKLPEAPG